MNSWIVMNEEAEEKRKEDAYQFQVIHKMHLQEP
jgi:hypothetical protein